MNLFNEKQNSFLVYSIKPKIDVLSYLYAKGYSVDQLSVYVAPNELYDAYICTSECLDSDDDYVRKSALEFIEDEIITECIIHYKNYGVIRLRTDGYEEPTLCSVYNLTTTYPIYIKDSISYSFPKSDRYINITDRSQLRVGMLVELFNNGEWVEKFVSNIDEEYEKIYKLFIKYNKIRTRATYTK